MISKIIGWAKAAMMSKTIIVNVLMAVVAVGVALQDTELLQQHPDAMGYIVSAVAAVNVVLRFLTNKPLSDKVK